MTKKRLLSNLLNEFRKKDFLENGIRSKNLLNWIYNSLLTKKKVIEEDEYETDLRRVMNYGHTFGHAIEAITDHAIPHGTAVAFGIDIVNYFSLKYGLISRDLFLEMHQFIKEAYPQLPSLESTQLMEVAKTDKKVVDNAVNFALLDQEEGLIIRKSNFDDEMKAILDEYLEGYQSAFSSWYRW